MSSLSAWFMYFVFPLCIFKPTFRLSEFKLFRCFSICFVVSLKRATASANLKLVRFSPSSLTPSVNFPNHMIIALEHCISARDHV